MMLEALFFNDGDKMAAIVIHGFVLEEKLPAEPDDTVNLPQITFVKAL